MTEKELIEKLPKPSTAREAVGGIDDILHRPYDGDGSWVNGEYKVRLALHERISLRNQLAPLISPPMVVLSDEQIKVVFMKHFTLQYGEEAATELLDRLPDFNYAKAISQATIEGAE